MVELNKNDEEYIESIKDSNMSKEKKDKLIKMVKANRIVTNTILKAMELQ